jgi:hypothetical protein
MVHGLYVTVHLWALAVDVDFTFFTGVVCLTQYLGGRLDAKQLRDSGPGSRNNRPFPSVGRSDGSLFHSQGRLMPRLVLAHIISQLSFANIDLPLAWVHVRTSDQICGLYVLATTFRTTMARDTGIFHGRVCSEKYALNTNSEASDGRSMRRDSDIESQACQRRPHGGCNSAFLPGPLIWFW